MPRLHRESLLQIPLVERAFSDPQIRTCARAIDRHWSYEGFVASSMTGFNPFGGQFFHGVRSRIADWLVAPRESARPHNPRDQLVTEVLFAVHDYLHAWTYGLVRAAFPKLELATGPIRANNLEDLVFVHLVTEAAATVGLDYWYLATVDLDEVCPIGTAMTTLTIGYAERHRREFRRARPDLVIQHKDFFAELAAFYCTGVLHGFDHRDVARSPLLDRWLRHELVYGTRQRAYVREWLSVLGGLPFAKADGDRPVAITKKWQRTLLREVGDRLWALVKRGRDAELDIAPAAETWKLPAKRALDPRFVNLNTLDDDDIAALGRSCSGTPAFTWVMDQYLSRFDFSRFDRDKLALVRAVREHREWTSLHALCNAEVRVAAGAEPRELMLLN